MSAVPETVDTTDGKAGGTSEGFGATDVMTVGARADGTSDGTTVEDNAGNKAVIATIEAAVNKVATETTGVTEAATDVPPTVANEVVEPSTTTIGPVPVATT